MEFYRKNLANPWPTNKNAVLNAMTEVNQGSMKVKRLLTSAF